VLHTTVTSSGLSMDHFSETSWKFLVLSVGIALLGCGCMKTFMCHCTSRPCLRSFEMLKIFPSVSKVSWIAKLGQLNLSLARQRLRNAEEVVHVV
jgi:hypothetical protein